MITIIEKLKVGMAFIVKTKKESEFEIGFRLGQVHWYKGQAKEITRGFVNYSRHKLNAYAVIEEVYKDNIKSKNVFEKLDFLKSKRPHGDDGLIYRYNLH